VWKIESTRLVAAIARVTHDIGIAEELAQDALVTALELCPQRLATLNHSESAFLATTIIGFVSGVDSI